MADKNEKLSAEQLRLSKQVEILRRDMVIAEHRSPDSVDKDTGKTIPNDNPANIRHNLLLNDSGNPVTPDEFLMEKEGWGRIATTPADETRLIANINTGIRTSGDDELNIVLVKTKNNPGIGKEEHYGKIVGNGETRRWEYHISHKDMDALNPENVLKVPVFNVDNAGLYADIGNAGSTYTSKDFTGNGYQAQKVTRNADNIEIIVPPPAGMGTLLAVIDRDPFEAFAGKKALRGGTIVVPDASTDRVDTSLNTVIARLKGDAGKWGQVIFTSTYYPEYGPEPDGMLYNHSSMPQDYLIWKEQKQNPGLRNKEYLGVKGRDGHGYIPEGEEITICNNNMAPSVIINEKRMEIAPDLTFTPFNKWDAPPIWIHGPGNKGITDVSHLDGGIIIAGGGTIKIAQKPIGNWFYADVTLVGGTKENKAVYTIEIPQFDDPNLKLDFVETDDKREYRLERNPMPITTVLDLRYPDNTVVPKEQTENDSISIRGNHIEVRVKEGEKIRTIFDSDKPELNKQSGILNKSGLVLGGIVFSAAADDMKQKHTRRKFLGASTAAAATLLVGGKGEKEKTEREIKVKHIHAMDPATSSLEELIPGIKIAPNGIVAPQPAKNVGRG